MPIYINGEPQLNTTGLLECVPLLLRRLVRKKMTGPLVVLLCTTYMTDRKRFECV